MIQNIEIYDRDLIHHLSQVYVILKFALYTVLDVGYDIQ